MTSRIIVAIVAAVLSLAAPVAVDAQTPTPTLSVDVNTIGALQVSYSGFTSGTTYYRGGCDHETTHPASCSFTLQQGFYQPTGGGFTCSQLPRTTSSGYFIGTRRGPEGRDANGRYSRIAAYSDSSCTTEVAAQTYTVPAALPTWSAREVSHDSATIYIQGAHSTHRITWWYYALTPGNGPCMMEGSRSLVASVLPTESPTTSLTGLSPGTTYTYSVHGHPNCRDDARGTVTFTTLAGGSPPGPAPPPDDIDIEVTPTTDATTDGSGSVTLSWSNPGDPDIASYEYYLRRSGGRGEWRTVAGSNADTTSMTIDLTTGEAVAGNARGVTPTVEWTVYLRTRGVNGGSSRAVEITFTTLGSASEPEPPEETPEPPEETPGSVPALPLAGLVTLALVLFLGGLRRRKGHS